MKTLNLWCGYLTSCLKKFASKLIKRKNRMRKIILYGGLVSGGRPRGGMNFVSVTIPCLFYGTYFS